MMVSLSRYAPPHDRFGAGSIGIALLVHGLLIAALTWGTQWRSETTLTTASAELWAAIPVEAAPPLTSQPPDAPVPIPVQTPEPPAAKTPEIVVEKVKPKQKTKEVKEKPESPKKNLKQEAAKRQEQEAERIREQVRQDQLKRMAGIAGASGHASSTGAAMQSAAPSASYAGKVEAKIRPNIVFAEVDNVQGNPAAEVDIRIAPDGTIVGAPKLVKSSGIKAWDTAVLRAIDRTETLPKDTDGRVPSSMTLILRPKR